MKFCLKRFYALLALLFTLVFLLVAHRLTRGAGRFFGGGLLGLQFGHDFIEWPTNESAAHRRYKCVQWFCGCLHGLGQDRVPAGRDKLPELGDRFITGVHTIRVEQCAQSGTDTPSEKHPDRAAQHTDQHADKSATSEPHCGIEVAALGHAQVTILVSFNDGR